MWVGVHRTIVVVDVEGFGDPIRTNRHQLTVRAALYRMLAEAFDRSGVPWRECEHEDLGDGVLTLIPPHLPKSLLVEAVPDHLLPLLRDHNEVSAQPERIRLRMALHAGEVHRDDHGIAGRAVVHAFRLVDVPVLKSTLKRSPGVLAIIASDWFHDDVVRHCEVPPYHRVRVRAKETDAAAWIGLPDAPQLVPERVADDVPRQLPAATRHFVGRAAELARLDDVSAPVVTIDGTAGIGKTTLAVLWAHRVKERYPDGQLYADLRGFGADEPTEPGSVLHGFLSALGVDPTVVPEDLTAKSALFRSVVADRRLLIVLDNARSADQVRPLLPGTPDCLVLVTSRYWLGGLQIRDGADRIAVDVLSDADAFALLAERVEPALLAAEPAAAAELVELCARLPLALGIVAARAVFPLSALVCELRNERGRLDALEADEADLNLRAVFTSSYAVLSPPAARLFRLLGVHPGPDVDVRACEAVTPGAARVLRELTAAHLITEHVPGRFRFHDLLRVYATERAADDREWRWAAARFLDHYTDTAKVADSAIRLPAADYAASMLWFTTEREILLALVSFSAEQGFPAHLGTLAWALTTFLRRTGRREERETVNRLAWQVAQASGDRTGEVRALVRLARAVGGLGRPQEATVLLVQALGIARELGDVTVEIRALLALTRAYEVLGKFERALEYGRLALDLLGEDDVDRMRADVLTLIGRQLLLLGRPTEAQPLNECALRLFSAAGNVEGQAEVLMNLGDAAQLFGDGDQAVRRFERSLELDRQLGDRYWEAQALNRIGDAVRGSRALAAWQQAVDILDELRHPDADEIRAKLH